MSKLPHVRLVVFDGGHRSEICQALNELPAHDVAVVWRTDQHAECCDQHSGRILRIIKDFSAIHELAISNLPGNLSFPNDLNFLDKNGRPEELNGERHRYVDGWFLRRDLAQKELAAQLVTI